jgi:hypothetical protein
VNANKKTTRAHEILSTYPGKLRNGDVSEPQCSQEIYADTVSVSVGFLLAGRSLTGRQAELIADAIYAAYQLGRVSST